uniref:Uncharacterized protein n=1 Tax=Oryza rufipogon TaxID=4529 RepID=A0A0E0QJE3_ORYRU
MPLREYSGSGGEERERETERDVVLFASALLLPHHEGGEDPVGIGIPPLLLRSSPSPSRRRRWWWWWRGRSNNREIQDLWEV